MSAGSISRVTLPLWIFILAALVWLYVKLNTGQPAKPVAVETTRSEIKQAPTPAVVPGDRLLEDYGNPEHPPIEDLRKVQRVVSGYFSVIKDASRNAIGGNEDLAAALLGENPNREIFVRPGSRVLSQNGLLIDRWGTPLIVHPQAWRQLELRSAGPDKIPYNADDLILQPDGSSGPARE